MVPKAHINSRGFIMTIEHGIRAKVTIIRTNQKGCVNNIGTGRVLGRLGGALGKKPASRR
jgi:hypothetical protein